MSDPGHRPRFVGGALLASALAGPMLVLPVSLAATLAEQRDRLGIIQTLPLVLLAATIFGFVIALLPNLLGTALLFHLGKMYRWTRNPLLWMFAGAALGAAIGTPFDIGLSGHAGASLFAGVGIPCALICRALTRWAD